jgi:phosphoribosyl-ATP pyrophosphohydrolase/phosphoribosyl-AMP cyclohydrolase/histidinol dehydrogenase
VDVEVVLNAEDVIKSDGCLAACLLDSGCHAIVVDGVNVNAMDAAKIPRTRLVAHFSSSMPTLEQVDAASLLASTISVEYHGDNKASADDLQALLMLGEKSKDTSTVVQVRSEDCDASNAVELSSMIGELDGPVALVDPTPTQLGLCYAARMKTDRPDGLFTTVVCTRAGEALGLVYSSKESIVAALECGRGVYFSRSRKGLWRKGDTSGHYQVLHRLDVDCDGDALRFTVTQRGDDTAAFCHLNTLTCWGEPRGLRHLEQTLNERLKSAPEGSYTKRLFEDEDLLRDKLVEEAQELSEAQEPDDVAGELADVLYFAMVRAAKAGVSIDEAVAELDRRTRKVTRRKGDSKGFRIVAGNAILNTDAKK